MTNKIKWINHKTLEDELEMQGRQLGLDVGLIWSWFWLDKRPMLINDLIDKCANWWGMMINWSKLTWLRMMTIDDKSIP